MKSMPELPQSFMGARSDLLSVTSVIATCIKNYQSNLKEWLVVWSFIGLKPTLSARYMVYLLLNPLLPITDKMRSLSPACNISSTNSLIQWYTLRIESLDWCFAWDNTKLSIPISRNSCPVNTKLTVNVLKWFSWEKRQLIQLSPNSLDINVSGAY